MHERIDHLVRSATPARVVAGAFALFAVVAGLDYLTGFELSFSVFYLLPVAALTWRFGRRGGLLSSGVGAVLWLLVDLAGGHVYRHPVVPYWNAVVRLAFFAVVSQLLAALVETLQRETLSARTDPLTGLYNRRGFAELAEREIQRARRAGRPLTLAVIDIDDFKSVNDWLGHDTGDEALRAVASAAQGSLRAIDVTARLGGDEFAVLLPDASPEEARRAIDRLRGMVAETVSFPIGLSVGLVAGWAAADPLDEALTAADEALLRAKRSGKGCTEVVLLGDGVAG